ncbi:MFS transporter [Leucobacter luti]|uniref:MFS transporter n=1 Tax=Leucobacter luti TaxID=340320 RepID=UPI003D078CF0
MSFRISWHRDRSSVRAWLVLVCLSILQFFIAVDVTVVNVALPSIGAEFGASESQLTWVVVAYTITGGGLLMLGGRLGDVFGRRRVLLTGTAIFGAASLLAGIAWSFPILVAARLLQGAGEALALPAAMAAIVMLFPEGRGRSRALSVWAAVASCGLVLGFVLSGVITEFYGWRWIFLVAIPFVLLVLVTAGILLPAGNAAKSAPLDLPGAILLTATPLLFVFGIIEAGSGAHTATWVAALAGSFVCAALFVVVERRAANPLVPMTFFRNQTRVLANGATALLSAALSTSFLLFTFYLQERLGLSPLATGFTLIPLAVSLVIAATFVPRLLDRWGARACILAGLVFTALAMGTIAIVVHMHGPAPAMIPAMILIAAGMGFGLVGLQYAAVSGVTDQDAGIASGVQRASDQLGGSTGIALYLGIGFAPAFTGDAPYLVSSALAVIGLIAAGALASRIVLPSTREHRAISQ